MSKSSYKAGYKLGAIYKSLDTQSDKIKGSGKYIVKFLINTAFLTLGIVFFHVIVLAIFFIALYRRVYIIERR